MTTPELLAENAELRRMVDIQAAAIVKLRQLNAHLVDRIAAAGFRVRETCQCDDDVGQGRIARILGGKATCLMCGKTIPQEVKP